MKTQLVERQAHDELAVHVWANRMLRTGMTLVSITLSKHGWYNVYALGDKAQIEYLGKLERENE